MTPMCHICLVPHGIDHMTRFKLVLSDSTLNGVQYIEGWGWEEGEIPIHVDMETISGGRIATLRRAWERSYAGQPLPVDTLMVAGLNDVRDRIKAHENIHDMEQLAELVSGDIITEMEKFYLTISEHSRRYQVDDTTSIARLLHVPALYWHAADGELPSASYINYAVVIDKLNLKIDEFNLLHGSCHAPGFLQRAGERGGSKRMYRFGVWREENKESMLHLKDAQRFKMMKHIFKYFTRATPRAYQI